MLTFRLKYLFCLILVIGVALMWWTWWTDDLTANRLLMIRENLQTIPHDANLEDYLEGIGIPPPHNSGMAIGQLGIVSWRSPLWLDCKLWVMYESSPSASNPTNPKISWQADWPAIEARAVEENWTFYRQVFVTVLAVLTIGWVVIRGRRR